MFCFERTKRISGQRDFKIPNPKTPSSFQFSGTRTDALSLSLLCPQLCSLKTALSALCCYLSGLSISRHMESFQTIFNKQFPDREIFQSPLKILCNILHVQLTRLDSYDVILSTCRLSFNVTPALLCRNYLHDVRPP